MATILDKYQNGKGTPLAYPNVIPGTPSNKGATKQSKLHNLYSITGDKSMDYEVNKAYQAYNDGVVNSLPKPSLLDLNGTTPAYAYTNNLPEKGIDKRAVDLTPPPGR